MKLLWVIIGIFLLVGLLMIKSQTNADLSDSDDRKSFITASFSWIKDLGSNVLSLVGYSVKELDWLPNETKGEE